MSAADGARPAVRRLAPSDLAALVALQRTVADEVPREFLFLKSDEQLAEYLDGARGAAYGHEHGGALVAAALLNVPAPGRELGEPRIRVVPRDEWPLRTCFLENAMVLAFARGRGLQRALVDARCAHAASLGMRWACSGIALANVASWRNLLAAGFVVGDVRLDFGYPLIGLARPLDGRVVASDPDDRCHVSASDGAAHEAALRGGYVGVRLAGDGTVVYQRLLVRSA